GGNGGTRQKNGENHYQDWPEDVQEQYQNGHDDNGGRPVYQQKREAHPHEYLVDVPVKNGDAETERDKPADDGKREEIILRRNFLLRHQKHGK
ncbi:MAG: hypothetical protein LBD68_00175, partial [Zoogloeaceae bacterium]|nr:hypothetical protein [Zoogloeaceae bacterium]